MAKGILQMRLCLWTLTWKDYPEWQKEERFEARKGTQVALASFEYGGRGHELSKTGISSQLPARK